jgi:hypothetical protein
MERLAVHQSQSNGCTHIPHAASFATSDYQERAELNLLQLAVCTAIKGCINAIYIRKENSSSFSIMTSCIHFVAILSINHCSSRSSTTEEENGEVCPWSTCCREIFVAGRNHPTVAYVTSVALIFINKAAPAAALSTTLLFHSL